MKETDHDALFAELHARLHPESWTARQLVRLRSLTTPTRIVAGASAVIALCVAFVMIPVLRHGASHAAASHAVHCFAYGALFAGLALSVAFALRRAHRRFALISFFAAAAANSMLLLHCSVKEVPHLLGGHFSLLLVVPVAAALIESTYQRHKEKN